MPLEEYRKKRNFRSTSEPAGSARRSGRAQTFVIQKHDASHLHYDFRLAIDGVLVSWAVPKGPTLDPAVKRFAKMTEDHPLEYADFEGVIPEGEYGAGTVMVWDRGSYELEEEMPAAEQLARGEIKIILQGKKLRGGFVLVHMGRAKARPREKSRWLLIKRKDEYAKRSWNPEQPEVSFQLSPDARSRKFRAGGKSASGRPNTAATTVLLREQLRKKLAGWKDDVPADWRKILGDTELNFESRAFMRQCHANEIVIPGRKGDVIPGSSDEGHLFRAFDHLRPDNVRAVILGQDPYSNPAWATGRAFEQGNLSEWPKSRREIADSLRSHHSGSGKRSHWERQIHQWRPRLEDASRGPR